jgi:hypothetical protein
MPLSGTPRPAVLYAFIEAYSLLHYAADVGRTFLNVRKFVGFEVFTAVTMKNVVFCDVTPCGSHKNRRFNVVSSSSILDTMMMKALSSSETSVLIRASRRNIPENGILHG